jgi:large subunit ribosomal protein L35Ae
MEKYAGVFITYSYGAKQQYARNSVIKITDLEPIESSKVIGWWVSWPEKNPKLFGKILGVHGKSGNLMARFQKGLPGQALGEKVTITKTKSDTQI